MFKRRKPRTMLENLREALWPSMGWQRAFRYAKHRMIRLDDTTRKIAAGLALGAAISFSPLIGTHFIQVAVIAYFMRINVLASLVGTVVGNPWTFPFIWWLSYTVGAYICGVFGWHGIESLPDQLNFEILWEIFKTQPLQILMPWMLGGYLVGFFVWFPAYFIYYYFLKAARAARKRVRLRRLHKVAKEVTGQKE